MSNLIRCEVFVCMYEERHGASRIAVWWPRERISSVFSFSASFSFLFFLSFSRWPAVCVCLFMWTRFFQSEIHLYALHENMVWCYWFLFDFVVVAVESLAYCRSMSLSGLFFVCVFVVTSYVIFLCSIGDMIFKHRPLQIYVKFTFVSRYSLIFLRIYVTFCTIAVLQFFAKLHNYLACLSLCFHVDSHFFSRSSANFCDEDL